MIHHTLVLGLGAMGSAALFHLAKRGLPVLGIDQFDPPHAQGSSHGETRVIREAYFEHPTYVPLVQRAYELWDQLERDSGQALYLKTGGLMIGRAESAVFSGSVCSAREHQLPHEILTATQIRQRHPGLRPDDDMLGLLEPRAGLLYPEKCIAAHLALARQHGAEVRTNTRVLDWKAKEGSITLRTAQESFEARNLIVSAGPWLGQLVPELAAKLQVERQVLLWFDTQNPGLYAPARFPIHLWEYAPEQMFYGFPDLGDGLKIAFHHQGEMTSAESADRTVREADVKKMRELMRRYLPEAAEAKLLRGAVCLYTNTPDGHFIIDRHPAHSNVIVASPCSGHGFKFASAVGEVLAQLAAEETPPLDVSLFALKRFSRSGAS